MNIRSQLKIRKLATAFFLAAFVFLSSSTSALAASKDNVAANLVDRVEDAVFSDSKDTKSASTNDNFISASQRERLLDPAQIPAEKQPIIDRSDPDNKLLEKSIQAFEDAAELAP